MCTSITMKNKSQMHLLARTMDFSFELDPNMIIIPQNAPLNFMEHDELKNHYAFMGLSKDVNNNFLFADGINEHGLSAAVLYFAGYATYNEKKDDKKANLAPYEVLSYLLATCKDVNEVIKAFKHINIYDEPLSFIGSTPPFHWVVLDKTGESVILEPLKTGLTITPNTLGVMANSPDINWHYTNVRNYIGLDRHFVEPLTINGLNFQPFGQGNASFGLPGDYTPPSRFLRALYNKLTINEVDTESELIVLANAVLNSVKIPKGTVKTNRNTIDYTQYTSFMSVNNLNYYFSLYNDPAITKVSLNDYKLDGNKVIIKKLSTTVTFTSI